MVNLTRDVELSQSYLTKVNSEANVQGEQFNYMKDRVHNLESDLERAIKEKTDSSFEVKRLEGQIQILNKQLEQMRVESIRNEGDNQTSSATVQRLQT